MFSRRGFLIGGGSLLTAAFVSDARSFIRKAGLPLLVPPPQPDRTIFWYAQDDGRFLLTLGEYYSPIPPAPSWREFFVMQEIEHTSEDGVEEVWENYLVRPEAYDRPMDAGVW
jgi:hypothetical protein